MALESSVMAGECLKLRMVFGEGPKIAVNGVGVATMGFHLDCRVFNTELRIDARSN
jgi:hypothetical protein